MSFSVPTENESVMPTRSTRSTTTTSVAAYLFDNPNYVYPGLGSSRFCTVKKPLSVFEAEWQTPEGLGRWRGSGVLIDKTPFFVDAIRDALKTD